MVREKSYIIICKKEQIFGVGCKSVKRNRSSGSGASPNRRYSPRTAHLSGRTGDFLSGKNSGTDSIVWMREEI